MWLSLIVISILAYSSLTDDFLSKFQQNKYKIKDIIAQVDWYDKNYLSDFKIVTYKYNRSIAAVNGSLSTKMDVDNRLECLVQVYKFGSNEYRDFPVHFQTNVKKAWNFNVIGLQGISQCGNINDINFLKNHKYYFCNFLIDETKYPPLIPTGRYKVEVKLIFLGHLLGTVSGFGEAYVPVKIPTINNN